ncbi:MAG: hypothetical protein AB1634_13905 [Thermodesulfobacteriota bacterium]
MQPEQRRSRFLSSLLRRAAPRCWLLLVEEAWPNWEERLRRVPQVCRGWLRGRVDQAVRLVLLLAAVWLLCLVVLFFGQALWAIYLSTPVGSRLAGISPDTVAAVSLLLDHDLVGAAWAMSFLSFCTLLALGAAAQLLACRRLFYEGRGLMWRLLWLALGCQLASVPMAEHFRLAGSIAVALTTIPVACLLGPVLDFCGRTLPELNIFQLARDLAAIRERLRIRHPGRD